jgi:hypothetical protein
VFHIENHDSKKRSIEFTRLHKGLGTNKTRNPWIREKWDSKARPGCDYNRTPGTWLRLEATTVWQHRVILILGPVITSMMVASEEGFPFLEFMLLWSI